MPHTPDDLAAMYTAVGIKAPEELFSDIPTSLSIGGEETVPGPLSELELAAHLQAIADQNRLPELTFLGGGAYRHYVPAAVDAVLSRGEFLTSYTPYQPEVSQGNLQAAWEYQSLMAALVGMDVVNASLYDGATAAAEAMLMCVRSTGRREVLVSDTVHPHIREVLATYATANGLILHALPRENGVTSRTALGDALNDAIAGVLMQSPNFFGLLEDFTGLAELIHRQGALFAPGFTEAIALGMIAPPGDFHADIVWGEGQSLGVPLSFGGPGLGIIACRKDLARKLPGRIVGRTVDTDGRPGFVLTLQAREQHIRREHSTSNICSNHALSALAAAVYLSIVGKTGLQSVAELNFHHAHAVKEKLLALTGRGSKVFTDVFPGPFFNEFVIHTAQAARLHTTLFKKGIAFGIPLEPWYSELTDCLLVTVTELHRRADIDRLIEELV